MVNMSDPDRPTVAWVDTGSGPGYEIPLTTREDQDAAAILATVRAEWPSYGDPEEQDVP